MITLQHLRTYAVARSLFAPTTLTRAIERLGFVQADPICAPARAQDLTLRHRVEDYRAGDLARRYAELPIEEDYFVNYGFVPRRHSALMLPREPRRAWDRPTRLRAARVLEFVAQRGEAHPRDVDEHFAHGTVKNYWGGSSNATTQLLDQMHYRGLVRVARREAGVRVYAPWPIPRADDRERSEDGAPSRRARAESLVALAVAKYAPLPAASLGPLVSRLRHAAPQLWTDIKRALERARIHGPHARIDGLDWYWAAGEDPLRASEQTDLGRVRFLAPFDPIVWDRRRFELFWRWAYRFEAYTPTRKRKLGYYALPLLWQGEVIGWGNLAANDGALSARIGYVAGRAPRDRAFRRALDEELEHVRRFLGCSR